MDATNFGAFFEGREKASEEPWEIDERRFSDGGRISAELSPGYGTACALGTACAAFPRNDSPKLSVTSVKSYRQNQKSAFLFTEASSYSTCDAPPVLPQLMQSVHPSATSMPSQAQRVTSCCLRPEH